MDLSADVCIVGAGPGGALLALLLAQKNISVILVEQHDGVAKAFRGEHLNEEGEGILKKFQLYDAVEKLGLLKMEKLEYWENGKLLKAIVPDAKVGHLGIHVPQAHLLTAILDEAKQYHHFKLLTNTRVQKLLQDETGKYDGVQAVCDHRKINIQCELIIGADGRYSTVRKKADIPIEIRSHGYDLLWAKIPAPADWEPSIKMALIEGKQLSLFTQANGFIQIGWSIEKGSFPKLRKQPFTPFIEQLIKAFPPLTNTVTEHIQSWKDFVPLDVHSSWTDVWGKAGVALIGDAAHAMTPTGAFGLNSALKDAETLASYISKETIHQIVFTDCAVKRKMEIAKLQAIQVAKERQFASQFFIYS